MPSEMLELFEIVALAAAVYAVVATAREVVDPAAVVRGRSPRLDADSPPQKGPAILKGQTAAPLLVAAIALAGCNAAAPSTETGTPERLWAQPSFTPPDEPYMEQAVAEAALNRWLSNEGAHSLEGFAAPYNMIERVEGPERGTIVLYVDNHLAARADPEGDLHLIAAEMLDNVGVDFPEIGRIIAATQDGKHSATVYGDQSDVIIS
ncbi:MAG: hypothetical protein ACTHWW_09770 [Arthrobacter sp.]|nr:hypothetical protein [Micrococcaceae bacterium]MDN5906484.1 hypothetical protein [Micrococcaceae bacterium]MDN6300696.1 hypothetical protein [Micrococcaceae bacterium]